MTFDTDSPKNSSEQPKTEQQDDPAVEAFKVYQKGGKEALRNWLENPPGKNPPKK